MWQAKAKVRLHNQAISSTEAKDKSVIARVQFYYRLYVLLVIVLQHTTSEMIVINMPM